jgi:two-component system chemotaxis response regulator CheB
MYDQPTGQFPTGGHDIIVIGASSGGVDALRVLLPSLPIDLPASVFVVLHVGARSHLAEILGEIAPLRVVRAASGAPVEYRTIYIAPPGQHLLLHDAHLLLRRGPRENMARPAIDPLFRSAAATFGGRVIGVVLSGTLNDGTAGLRAIKRCGGLAVVQDPSDADFPDMPESALRQVEVDHVSDIVEMAGLLGRLTHRLAGQTPEIPIEIRVEAAIAAQELTDMEIEDDLGTLSPFTCPECHGALWQIPDGGMLRYRCHVGHAFTAETVLSGLDGEVDNMLESLLRSHQQRAALAHRMAEQERGRNRESLAGQLEARAREYEEDAEVIRRMVPRHEDRSGATAVAPEGSALTNDGDTA